MAERLASAAPSPPPPPPGQPLEPTRSPEIIPAETQPAEPPRAGNSGTCTIQVPRVQLYRAPPPETAHAAGRRRKLPDRRRLCSCCGLGICGMSALLSIVLFLAGAVVFYFLVRPSSPRFSVEQLLVSRRRAAVRYVAGVRVRNPSVVISFDCPGGGSAVLAYAGAGVADGSAPSFQVGTRGTRTLSLELLGSVDDDMPEGTVDMSLSMDFPLQMRMRGLWSSAMAANLWCSLRVSMLAGGTAKVLSQSCQFDP